MGPQKKQTESRTRSRRAALDTDLAPISCAVSRRRKTFASRWTFFVFFSLSPFSLSLSLSLSLSCLRHRGSAASSAMFNAAPYRLRASYCVSAFTALFSSVGWPSQVALPPPPRHSSVFHPGYWAGLGLVLSRFVPFFLFIKEYFVAFNGTAWAFRSGFSLLF